MAVENRIVKVQKRNRALVRFDTERICQAILRASQSIGGFQQDYLAGTNDRLFESGSNDEQVARTLADAVVMLLNSDRQHLIANFPPTIERIQDGVLHVLRSYGFQNTADAYACYRWGRHWLREGSIRPDQFVGNGVPNEQLASSRAWHRQRGCDSLPGLNELVRRGKLQPLIDDSLGFYETALEQAARAILQRLNMGGELRMIWVTGPSSAGKTTTTVKLVRRLQKEGLRFVMLNLDDYFWSLVEHPTDWINDRNYETPEAIDIQLVNEHLRVLLEGGTVEKPVFDFKTGSRKTGSQVRLERQEILLLDCLHGLYPPLTEGIPGAAQFRLYLDWQTGIAQENGSKAPMIHSSDVRMLRRMLRDARHRNYSPLRTILHWHYVRSGELFSILPLSGLADYVVNTGLAFELPALKPFFCGRESHLPNPEDLAPYEGFLDAKIRYERVRRLLEGIEGLPFKALDDHKVIPGDAVVREFIGGSTLEIPHNL